MLHTLTPRQCEYLEFIREYIQINESSLRLEESAAHFVVTAPTAHKALQSKGFLYFWQNSISGFFIRLIERAGTSEIMIEVPIAGKVIRLLSDTAEGRFSHLGLYRARLCSSLGRWGVVLSA